MRERREAPDGSGTSGVIRLLPAVMWMGLIFALSARQTLPPTPGLAENVAAIGGHLGAYGVLAVLLCWGLGGARIQAMWLGLGIAVLYGVSDEFHQSFVPGRDASLIDIGWDALGAATALVAWRWLSSHRST